ncbi:MAG: tripartite tricarboxylate transporter TctB family protein [Oscillospiraceae bacterium]|nr:tripartite tricarboxylate transporter TctB family protein [Oscillospiraceae bacterium]
MKMKRDAVTGIVGLVWSLIWFVLIQTQTRMPPKLLEPGPRLLPYVGLVIVAVSSLMLLLKGLKDWKRDPKPDKPYFPKGGILKVTKSYLMLVATAVLMAIFGFVITAPFAIFAFIYDLKGNSKVKPLNAAIISVLVTAGLYAMFVLGFQVKLPTGILFG